MSIIIEEQGLSCRIFKQSWRKWFTDYWDAQGKRKVGTESFFSLMRTWAFCTNLLLSVLWFYLWHSDFWDVLPTADSGNGICSGPLTALHQMEQPTEPTRAWRVFPSNVSKKFANTQPGSVYAAQACEFLEQIIFQLKKVKEKNMVRMTLAFFHFKGIYRLWLTSGEYDLITGIVTFSQKCFGSFKLDIDNWNWAERHEHLVLMNMICLYFNRKAFRKGLEIPAQKVKVQYNFSIPDLACYKWPWRLYSSKFHIFFRLCHYAPF